MSPAIPGLVESSANTGLAELTEDGFSFVVHQRSSEPAITGEMKKVFAAQAEMFGFSIEELLLDYVYDEAAMKELIEAHSPRFSACSAVLYFHGYEGVVDDVSAALKADEEPGVVDTLLFYEPGQKIQHGVGAMPYVVRYYVKASSYDELDELTERLFSEVKVLDAQGNDLLYPNTMMRYAAPAPTLPVAEPEA